jgi:hypothetical protein
VEPSALRSAVGSDFENKQMIYVLHLPDSETARIDSIWAFLSIDDDGNEAVIAGPLLGPGSYVPLIAADARRLSSLTVVADAIARDSGRIVRLVKFTSREVVRELGTRECQ